MSSPEQNQWKKAAAGAAAALVKDGMVVGLGTGSTAAFFVEALGRRVAEEGLRVSGIPSSEQTAALAHNAKIPLSDFSEHTEIDLTIDGADEIQRGTLYLIKGHGGALLREKILAASSRRMIAIADETKLVDRLGSLVSVPVEVARFGWQATREKLAEIAGNPSLRLAEDNSASPYVTDGDNFILDLAFGAMPDPKEIAHHLDHIVGVVEHGLFLGYAGEAIVAGRGGVKTLRRDSR